MLMPVYFVKVLQNEKRQAFSGDLVSEIRRPTRKRCHRTKPKGIQGTIVCIYTAEYLSPPTAPVSGTSLTRLLSKYK
jgi:hypothetical protein